ncbi:sec1 family domain-containing protein 2 [Tachyglossus aculeatus]|uniref:sec1 family domain-containing protein 2 n=1 Tax=Tachyglossus aculeatus TaxID=9261 RepID=UPI0018F73E06|nr:sec1 family domain-containing protein 2 [Tachyglossus aculeatus]
MGPPGLLSFAQQAWEPVLAQAAGADVYLDGPSAESLHWAGGAERLLGGRPGRVRALGPAGAGGEGRAEALVVVLSGPPRGPARAALRELLRRGHFRRCVVAIAAQASRDGDDDDDPQDRRDEDRPPQREDEEDEGRLEERLRRWMGRPGCTARVLAVPLLLAPVAPHLALAPGLGALWPPAGGRPGPEGRRQGRRLVCGLSALCGHLGVREDCFAVGELSRRLAAQLANFGPAKSRRRAAAATAGRASVLFVDRTLDLTGAVGHHGDNLVEKMLSILPKLPGHTTDVMVDMRELTALRAGGEEDNRDMIAPGCLAQPNDAEAKALWESLLTLKQKEAVMEVRRHLVEAASRENLPIKMSMGRVTPGQLRSYIQLFKTNPKALESHSGLLQLGLATVQTLEHPRAATWDNFLAFERLLLQSVGEEDLPSLLDQLLPAIKPADRRTGDDFAPDDVLLLLVYVYSVVGPVRAGPELQGAEERAKAALADVLCREPTLSPLCQKITVCESSLKLTYPRAKTVVDELFRTLRAVTRARSALKQFNSVYTPGNHAHQALYKPLLKQVVEEIFHPERPDPVDIEYVSSGLTDLLKTGFSMFMKVSRPHPGDHPLLILVVIGGVTVAEAKMVKDLVAALKPSTQVLVLSTRLLEPRSVPELLFAADPLPPNLEA